MCKIPKYLRMPWSGLFILRLIVAESWRNVVAIPDLLTCSDDDRSIAGEHLRREVEVEGGSGGRGRIEGQYAVRYSSCCEGVEVRNRWK